MAMNKQLQDMQKRLAKVEEDLKDRIVEATSGGGTVSVKLNGVEEVVAVKIDEQVLSDRGMVKVKVNGGEEVVDIKIEKDVINPDDKGMLEDLVLAAVNEGIKKAKKLRETEMVKVTGVSMPGLF